MYNNVSKYQLCRWLLLAVVRLTLEYSIQVWEAKKAQAAAALESVSDGGAKHILGFSSRTCNKAIRGTWDWILYSAIDIRQSLSGGIY